MTLAVNSQAPNEVDQYTLAVGHDYRVFGAIYTVEDIGEVVTFEERIKGLYAPFQIQVHQALAMLNAGAMVKVVAA